MADIIDIREHQDGNLAGEFICTGCGHTWHGVSSVGDTAVECPGCRRYMGVIRAEVVPPQFWQCGVCTADLFYLTPGGAICRMCGAVATNWADK